MKKLSLIILILLLLFSIFWFYYPARSMVVMSIYSAIHERDSVMFEEGFKIDMPGGPITPERDWYPFVMTFNADSFSARSGDKTDMSIMYNFPAFDPKTRTNQFYDADSPYCSAFYGAYVIRTGSTLPYGYSVNGDMNFDEILYAFRFDYVNLVLKSLGNHDFIFIIEDFTVETAQYLGFEDWTVINADIITNSVVHNYSGSKRSYIQYGRPFDIIESDYEKIEVHGRLYIRFFEEYNSTIALYIMAQDINILENCDKHILGNTKIRLR